MFNEPLFIKATSQKKNKPSTPGCIKDRSLYFIPAGKTFFKKDTWAQLYEIYAIHPHDIDNKKEITIEGGLLIITIHVPLLIRILQSTLHRQS